MAAHCNTLQHTATHCNTLQHTATHCNTPQHTATHCNTLQHIATQMTSTCASNGGTCNGRHPGNSSGSSASNSNLYRCIPPTCVHISHTHTYRTYTHARARTHSPQTRQTHILSTHTQTHACIKIHTHTFMQAHTFRRKARNQDSRGVMSGEEGVKCSMLLYIAVCCRVLPCLAVHCTKCTILQHTTRES